LGKLPGLLLSRDNNDIATRNMKRKNVIFLAIVGYVLTAAGCGEKDCEKMLKTVNSISTDAFGKLPYTGTDTLYFTDANNDTSIVVGQGKQQYYEETSQSVTPDCFNVVQSEAFRISFKPIKGDLYFDVYQKANGKNIVLSPPAWPVHFYIDYVNVGGQHPLNKDTLTINGRVYANVSTATPKDVTFGIIDHSYLAYYNQPYGVLHIRSSKEDKAYSLLR
jgi:hypothetical protein